jgi:hypothetical protein
MLTHAERRWLVRHPWHQIQQPLWHQGREGQPLVCLASFMLLLYPQEGEIRARQAFLLQETAGGSEFPSIGGDKVIHRFQLIALLEHGLNKRLILLLTQLKAFCCRPAQGQGELAEVQG